MNYDWYRIFKISEFDDLDLVSKTYTVELQDRGIRDIFVTKGILYSILYDGVFLTLNLNEKNPYEKDGLAIYSDDEGFVYLGFLVNES